MDTSPPTPSHPESLETLRQSVKSLQIMMIGLFTGILLVCCSVNLVILRQLRVAQEDLERKNQVLKEYSGYHQRVNVSLMKEFLTRLQEYESQVPELKPILERYSPSSDSSGSLPNP